MKEGSWVRIYLKQMRIKSWLKNLFVFFPIVFSLELFKWGRFLQAVILALSFCLVSSAIYVLNDISDVEKDRKHAVKRNRPIASGQIPIPRAWILFLSLMAAGLGTALSVNLFSFLLILAYVEIGRAHV